MNEENFTNYLKELAHLYQIPYEELKTLVVEHPYCQNLHHLLLEKSQLDNHPNVEKVLERTALYSSDRSHLFRKMRKMKADLIREKTSTRSEEQVLPQEEYLELPDLRDLGTALPELSAEQRRQELPPTQPLHLSFVPESDFRAVPEHEPTDPPKPKAPDATANQPAESPANPAWVFDTEVVTAIATALRILDTTLFRPKNLRKAHLLSAPNGQQSKPARRPADPPNSKAGPRPKTSFPSWVQQFQPTHVKLQLSELMEAKKHEESRQQNKQSTRQSPEQLSAFIQRSIAENQELASETLAELLVAQMQYEKAIRVYERLILKFPEKSTFFAQKISQLKKLMV